MTSIPVCSQTSASFDFLEFVYCQELPKDLFIGINRLAPKNEGDAKKARRIETQFFADLVSAADHATTLNGRYDLYFNVGLVASPPKSGGRGGADDVVFLPGLWADIDCAFGKHLTKEPLCPDIETAQSLLSKLETPTVLVASGGGLHAYWLFEEVKMGWDVENIAKACREWQEAIRAEFKPYKIDSTHDAARMMRLPGTANLKCGKQCEVISTMVYPSCFYQLSDLRRKPHVVVDNTSCMNVEVKPTIHRSTTTAERKPLAEQELKALLGRIPAEKADDYESWLCVGMALHSEGKHNLGLWDEWSKQSGKYEPGGCAEKWKSFSNDSNRERVTVGSLYHLAGVKRPETVIGDAPKEMPKVLGKTRDHEVLLWIDGAVVPVPASKINTKTLRLMLPVDKRTADAVEEHIFQEAGRCRGFLDTRTAMRSGLWRFGNEWLVVSGGRSRVYRDDGGIVELEVPVYRNRLIEHEVDWLNWEVEDSELGSLYAKVRDYVRQWNWQDEEMADYVAAFAMLSPFQQGFDWRPWLYLSGARNTGKSYFFENCLGGLWGNLVSRLDKATAHSLAQELGNSSKIGILDEFEKYRHVGQVMELAKLCNPKEGGTKCQGTTGSRSLVYRLQHLLWFGSIYMPGDLANDAAKTSRMVRFELLPHKTNVPPQRIGSTLAGQIVLAVLQAWARIMEAPCRYDERADSRVNDNFRMVNKFLFVTTGNTRSVPEWAKLEIDNDGDKLLETILNSVSPNDSSITVADVLSAGGDLSTYGIKRHERNGEQCLAIYPPSVTRYILKDTEYASLSIGEPLGRIPGVERLTVKLSGKPCKCYVVPWLSLCLR